MSSRALVFALSFALLVVDSSSADSIVVAPGPRGQQTPDEFMFGRSGSRTVAGLILGAGVQSAFGHPGLTLPERVNDFATQGYFGPNFMADGVGAPIPEPASLILASSGVLGLLLRRRRR
jgi:hypothetical protein